jgi:hypothetical protein
MTKKTCSRCLNSHTDKFETCDPCRAYNNWNKLLYGFAKEHGLSYSDARDGLRAVIEAKGTPELF